ncbi:MAG: DUF1778 domain-containing protein [Gammaproteobacteria bacterium]|nr:DUF1778 domain-containing protein [Gammaproteobacteria bacterium]
MENRNQYLQIRVTAAEKAAIRRASQTAGQDMSGWILDRLLPASKRKFQSLVKLLVETPEKRRFIFAELNDYLSSLDKHHLSQVVSDRPEISLDDYTSAYLAAMVETAAHRCDIDSPSWTANVPGLVQPVFGSSLPGLRLHLLTHSPPPFRRRNIFIDSSIGDRV